VSVCECRRTQSAKSTDGSSGSLAGIEKDAITQAIANFPGVPHRLEHVCTLAGIDFINDSKATHDAAQVGLASVNSPVILIAGGEAKAGMISAGFKRFKPAAAVLLIGDAAGVFAQRLEQVGYSSYEIVETMEQAVLRAPELAKQYQLVVLSPACASFDRYQNFEQRGDHFRARSYCSDSSVEGWFPGNRRLQQLGSI